MNGFTLALTASHRGAAALAAMPFIDDDLLWCPDNDGRMVDMSQVCLGEDGTGNQLPAMAALQQQVHQQQQLLQAQQQHHQQLLQLQQQQQQEDDDGESPSTSTDLNSINPTIEPDDYLGQLELENLFQDFPVSIADIKEENNNDLSGADDGSEYVSIESPSSSSAAAAAMLQTQQQILGLQVLLQQQHNQQQQNNHRFSIAANPLLAEKLMSPNLAANLTNLDSLVNGARGRPPDIKGK